MDTKTLVAILMAVVVVALVVFVFAIERKRRSQRLKERFGPEYDQLVKEQGDPRRAEAVLADREKRVEKLSIRDLSRDDRRRYAEEWANVQKRFVDDPAMAVSEADSLVTSAPDLYTPREGTGHYRGVATSAGVLPVAF